MARDRNGLDILSPDECLALLATRPVGRIGLTHDGRPAVLPVTFALDGRDIIFATGTGSKSLAAAAEQSVAFEVDDFDPIERTGWSVLVVGIPRPHRGSLPVHIDLDPWVGHFATHVFRLPTTDVSGRRLRVNRDPVNRGKAWREPTTSPAESARR